MVIPLHPARNTRWPKPAPSNMTDRIAAMQDFKLYRGAALGGQRSRTTCRSSARTRRSRATRTSALYDMIICYGTEEYIDNKKKLVRYNFFKDEQARRRERHLRPRHPADAAGARAQERRPQGYGTEKRVILLHGPVGSSKSTIARLLKQGLEEYSRTPDGALYTFDWVQPRRAPGIAGEQRALPVAR